METDTKTEFRAAASGYFILCGLALVVSLPLFLICLQHPERLDWKFIFALGVLIGLPFAWLQAYRIEIGNGRIYYRTLFRVRTH
jgi:hypothetical protein